MLYYCPTVLVLHIVLTWRNERNGGWLSRNGWNARVTKEGSSQDIQSSHLQSLGQGKRGSPQTLEKAAKAQSGLAGPTLAGRRPPRQCSLTRPAILGPHSRARTQPSGWGSHGSRDAVTAVARSHRGPKPGFSLRTAGRGPTALTRSRSALLLPPSLRSPASPAPSHSARYSGPAIAFLSSAAHRLPVSPAPTTSTRSMATARSRLARRRRLGVSPARVATVSPRPSGPCPGRAACAGEGGEARSGGRDRDSPPRPAQELAGWAPNPIGPWRKIWKAQPQPGPRRRTAVRGGNSGHGWHSRVSSGVL